MIINTTYDLCLQSVSWYLQLQLICNRWPPWKHLSSSIDEESEQNPNSAFTELEPNNNLIFKSTQNRTLIIKEPELNPKFWVLSRLQFWGRTTQTVCPWLYCWSRTHSKCIIGLGKLTKFIKCVLNTQILTIEHYSMAACYTLTSSYLWLDDTWKYGDLSTVVKHWRLHCD